MQLGKINKQKGNNAENQYSLIFKELGFSDCVPSRYTSKRHDNAKIDLLNLPFNIQIKAGRQKNLNPGKELFSMFNCIQSMFPKEDEIFKRPYLLIHAKEKADEDMVYMSLEQFILYNKDSPNLTYSTTKEFKFEMNSEFKYIVGMSFNVFRNEIILKQ